MFILRQMKKNWQPVWIVEPPLILNILSDYVIPIVMVDCLAGEDIEESKK